MIKSAYFYISIYVFLYLFIYINIDKRLKIKGKNSKLQIVSDGMEMLVQPLIRTKQSLKCKM